MRDYVYYWESQRSHGQFRAFSDGDALERILARADNTTDPPLCLYTDGDGEFRIVREFK